MQGRFAAVRQKLSPRIPHRSIGWAAVLTGLLLLLSGCQLVQAGAWESMGPEQGGEILSLATDPFNSHLVYAGSSAGTVYTGSSNGGSSLVSGVGIPSSALVVALLVDPTKRGTIYAGTTAGLYVSTDQGSIWHARGTGFPAGQTMDALAYAPGSDILFAGSVTQGVFASNDHGNTWRPSNSGLPPRANVNALLFDPTAHALYVALDGAGVFASTDLGVNWSSRSAGLPKEVSALTELPAGGLAATGVTIYAGTDQGIYATTTGGARWEISGSSPRQPIYSLAGYPPIPGWIYAGTGNDVIRSPDGGRSWATVAPGLSQRVVAVVSVPATPSASSSPFVIYAASVALWRYPPEQGSGASSTTSLLLDGAVLVILLGLAFYFVRRVRFRMSDPAPPTPGRSSELDQSPATPSTSRRSAGGESGRRSHKKYSRR